MLVVRAMMSSSRGLAPALSVVLVVASSHARAAPPDPAPEARPQPSAEPPFAHKPLERGKPIALQLEDADLGELVRVIGELTGKRFVIASPKLAKVKASVFAPQKVTVDEAYQAFLAVLSANGLTVVPQGGFYKIIESQGVERQLTPLERGALPNEERYVTRIHRVTHLPASEVASDVLSKLATKDASIVPYGDVLVITETAANLRRMLEVLEVLDEAGEQDKIWFRPVRHLPASQVEKQLSEMLGLKGATPRGDGGALHVARIVALERPNAVVVVGTQASFERIVQLLDVVDVSPSNELEMQVIMLQHADAKKVVGPINEALGAAGAAGAAGSTAGGAARPGGSAAAPPAAAFEAQVKVAADETSNALIVTATPRDFVHVREVIRKLDRAKRQVFIECAILDVSTRNGLDLGVAWHGGHAGDAAIGPGGKTQTTYGGFRPMSSAGLPSANDLQAFALGVRGPDIPFLGSAAGALGLSSIPSFGALLTALATQEGADILSTPTILASDNTPAEIKVQLQTSLQPNAPQLNPFASGLGTGAAAAGGLQALTGFGSSGASNVGANYRGIGPKVKLTPHLNESDDVRLDIEEVISDIQSAPKAGDTFGTISYLERTAQTTLTVKNGQTVVIGGLVRNRVARTETKVPILGDIPLLGALFRSRGDTVEKSNLVLVLTPHIVRDESDMRRIFERKMQERQEMIDRDMVLRGMEWTPPKDWKLARGLVAHTRASYAELRQRAREAAELAAEEPAPEMPAPIELPVPQSVTPKSGGTPSPPAPQGGGGAPTRLNLVEP